MVKYDSDDETIFFLSKLENKSIFLPNLVAYLIKDVDFRVSSASNRREWNALDLRHIFTTIDTAAIPCEHFLISCN